MKCDRVLGLIGAIGAIVGVVCAIDSWVLPKIVPQIRLILGHYPWIGIMSLVLLIGSGTFLLGRRTSSKRKTSDTEINALPSKMPQGELKVRTEVDTKYPGKSITTITFRYIENSTTNRKHKSVI
jgi:hypothetical protein